MTCYQEQVRELTEIQPNISCHAFPVRVQVNMVPIGALPESLGSINSFVWSPSAGLECMLSKINVTGQKY